MKKKILYINYMLQYGHINFDHIHVNALYNQGYDVKVIVYDCIAKKMCLPKEVLLFTIPDWMDRNTLNGIINRIMYILALIYIRIRIRRDNYDHVIMSNVDEISLSIMPLCKQMLIYCHNPFSSMNSKLKVRFMKWLSRNNKFIVFNQHMTKPFHDAGINNVAVISHGCMQPYEYNKDKIMPLWFNDNQKIIFHPSNRPNLRFVEELIADESFQHRLEQLGAILLLCDRSGNSKSMGRIKVITEYLPDYVYKNIFLCSDILLLAYPDDFLYKVSGVSYECLANKKKMLILQNPSFFYCKDFYNYNPIFNSTKELADKIEQLLNHPEYTCISDIQTLTPDYNTILN